MRSRSRVRSKRLRARLVAEFLEDRSLPAGNVTAFVSAGILNVTGDAESNRVLVAAASGDSFVITSLDGTTTINGGAAPVTLGGVRGINAQMNAGSDLVHITGTSGDLTVFVDTGDGDDGVAMTFAKHDGMTVINTGAGDDVVSMGVCQFEALVIVNVGTGNNQVYLAGCQFDDSAFGGAGGLNQLSLLDVDFDRQPVSFGFLPATHGLMPHANNDSATAHHGGAVTVDVAANDLPVAGTLNLSSVHITAQPTHGTLTVNGDGTVKYTADGSDATSDTFRYTITNSAGAVSNEATATISLLPAIVPPDTSAPVPTITTTAPSPTNQSPIPFKVTFSEDVTTFGVSDLQVTNGTVSNFHVVDLKTYTFDVTPAASGNVVVTVPAGAAQDAAGNQSPLATKTVVADLTGPTVAVTTTASNTTNLPAIPFTATFSEAVANFALGDITVANGSASNFTPVDARTYKFDVTPGGDGTVTVTINAGVATDALGNPNTAGSRSVVSDRTAPTALVSSPPSPTKDSPILFTVTFNEPVTGLTAAALSATNGTVGTITPLNPRTFTVAVTPGGQGDVTLRVLTGVPKDLAGNVTTTEFAHTVTFDSVAPTVAIDAASTGAVTGTTTDASAVTGVQVSIFDASTSKYWGGSAFDSGTEAFQTAISGDAFATWSYALSATGTFTVHAVATDAAGNVGEATADVLVS